MKYAVCPFRTMHHVLGDQRSRKVHFIPRGLLSSRVFNEQTIPLGRCETPSRNYFISSCWWFKTNRRDRNEEGGNSDFLSFNDRKGGRNSHSHRPIYSQWDYQSVDDTNQQRGCRPSAQHSAIGCCDVGEFLKI